MHVDIVPNNIPLLLPKELMKRANMKLNFENDTIRAFGQPINLIVTKIGHYVIPITNNKRILNDLNSTDQRITLPVTNNKSDKNIDIKLHRQFAQFYKKGTLTTVFFLKNFQKRMALDCCF